MAALEPTNTKADQDQLENEIIELKLSLPKTTWFEHSQLLYHHGFWCPDFLLEGVVTFQKQFQPQDTDIILATSPKTGTTWLKSLLFSIINRTKLSSDISQHPLQTKNPHELVLYLEFHQSGLAGDVPSVRPVFKGVQTVLPHISPSFIRAPSPRKPTLHRTSENGKTALPDVVPRLFATHLPYLSLPDSMKTSKSRIVYVCRNPLDTFISLWHFYLQFEEYKSIEPNMELMEECLGKFCKGESSFGPYDDHLLGYWNESKKNPKKVLFIEYEGLKKEPKAHLKKLAEFVGCPFSEEEEKGNVVIDEILKLCSFKSLKEMEVNKSGKHTPFIENKSYFRKGEVGDWTNYLTPLMAKQFDQMLENFENVGFSFAYYQIKL